MSLGLDTRLTVMRGCVTVLKMKDFAVAPTPTAMGEGATDLKMPALPSNSP